MKCGEEMIDAFKEEQPYFVENIEKLVHQGRISHAYLIETRNYEKSSELVLAFAKYLYCNHHVTDKQKCDSCHLCSFIDEDTNSDLIQIYPDGTEIKKKQIADLKEKFMTKSLSEGFSRIYIIYEADKLNKYAANALLKFLEEPEEQIIGILVTSNRYQVMETLRSRCQIFSFINHSVDISFENYELTTAIIRCLEEHRCGAIAYLPEVLDKQYLGRNQWVQILTEIQYIYEQSLRKLDGGMYSESIESILQFVLSYNNEFSLLHKLEVIHEELRKLTYNLNVNLMLDDFIICFNK